MATKRIDPKIITIYLAMLKGFYAYENYTISKHIYYIAYGLKDGKSLSCVVNELLRE